MKSLLDEERFARYQSVVNVLLARESFNKPDIYKALMKVKSDRAFTEEQEKWLELIRRHLMENLIMEKDDVDYMPIFAREGVSWGKLNKEFGGELEAVIREINAGIAA